MIHVVEGFDPQVSEPRGVATHRFACITCEAVHEYVDTILTYLDALFMVQLSGWKVRANEQSEQWDTWCPTCRAAHDDWVEPDAARQQMARLRRSRCTSRA